MRFDAVSSKITEHFLPKINFRLFNVIIQQWIGQIINSNDDGVCCLDILYFMVWMELLSLLYIILRQERERDELNFHFLRFYSSFNASIDCHAII